MACFQATMSLSPGTRIGHDDVTALLGEVGWTSLGYAKLGVICAGRKLAAVTGQRLAQ